MKKITLFFIFLLVFALVHSTYSFDIEKGSYARYEMYKDPETIMGEGYDFSVALLKGDKEVFFSDFIYTYQILDIEDNIADVRICFEGELINEPTYKEDLIELPFKRIFDIKLNLDTLEMIDESGAWGKWLFWVPQGLYDRKEYTFMKNWNDHGKVTGWLGGPLEMKMQFLQSPYGKDLKYYIYLGTARLQDDTWIYPLCEDYGVPPREEFYFLSPEGEQISKPGLETYYFYTDEGLLLETALYIDDFLDQKLGIMILFGYPLLTDYGVSDETLIEDPKPEYQKSTFDEELSKIEELKEQQKLAEKTQTPEKTPQKREQEQQDTEEKENPLIYLVPIIVVVVIVAFIMFKEKR